MQYSKVVLAKPSEYVDSIFASVLATGYSYIASMATLLRHPFIGPLRLHAQQSRGRVPVSPYVIVFFTTLLVTALVANALPASLGGVLFAAVVRRTIAERSAPRELYDLVVATTIIVILLDLLIRLLSLIIMPRRRSRFTARLLFALSAALVYVALLVPLVFMIVAKSPLGDVADRSGFWAVMVAGGGTLVCLCAFLPAARLALAHLRQRSRITRIFQIVTLWIILALSQAAAFAAGGAARLWLAGPGWYAEYFACEAGINSLICTVVLHNRADSALVIDPDRLELTVCGTGGPEDCITFGASAVATTGGKVDIPIIVLPNSRVWLKVQTRSDAGLSTDHQQPCTLAFVDGETGESQVVRRGDGSEYVATLRQVTMPLH